MKTIIHIIEDDRRSNARTRIVDLQQLAHRAAELAWSKAPSGRAIVCEHGGSVANAYGWPASTDTGLAVAFVQPSFCTVHVCVYGSAIPANKATLRGAAESCMEGAGSLFDGRSNATTKADARERIYATAQIDLEASWSELETLDLEQVA